MFRAIIAVLIISLSVLAPQVPADAEHVFRTSGQLMDYLAADVKDGDVLRLAANFRFTQKTDIDIVIGHSVTLDGGGCEWRGSIMFEENTDCVLKDITFTNTGDNVTLNAKGALTVQGIVQVSGSQAVTAAALSMAENAILLAESSGAQPGAACGTLTMMEGSYLYGSSASDAEGVLVNGDAHMYNAWIFGVGGAGVNGGDGVAVKGEFRLSEDAYVQGAGGSSPGKDAETAGIGVNAATLVIADEARIEALGGNADDAGIGGAGLYAGVLTGDGFLFADVSAGTPNPIDIPGLKIDGCSMVIGKLDGNVTIETREANDAPAGYDEEWDDGWYDDDYGDDYGDLYDEFDGYDSDDYWRYLMDLFESMFGGSGGNKMMPPPEGELRKA